ncbi:tetratricopeptide repeat protein [Streptomyces diastatochromogenes]|nr:tetratricopeptide repeat protein [Streptomyces diastatochromogenes]
MGNAGKYSQDAVLRARVLLLGSEEPSLPERLGAYRVLAEVSPRAYLPRLVDALIERTRDFADPEILRALYGEAADVARRFDAEVPNREERLRRALSGYEHGLFATGRRAEGRAVCEELAEAGRWGRLAVVLAEEGRHGEAAELYGRHLAAREADDASRWTRIAWAAELDAAGQREEALEVFARLVDDHRSGAAEERGPLASLVWKLERYAGMLLAAGRRAEEAAARHEALALLARLARDGEPVSWSNIQAWWVTLLVLSGRPDEQAATRTPRGPRSGRTWSTDGPPTCGRSTSPRSPPSNGGRTPCARRATSPD